MRQMPGTVRRGMRIMLQKGVRVVLRGVLDVRRRDVHAMSRSRLCVVRGGGGRVCGVRGGGRRWYERRGGWGGWIWGLWKSGDDALIHSLTGPV